MRSEDRNYDIAPKIVPAGAQSRVTIRPRYVRLRGPLRISLNSLEGLGSAQPAVIETIAAADGSVSFECVFPSEQEYLVAVEDTAGSQPRFVAELRIYAVGPDLLHRRPFKGDLHMHSARSDGVEEPPYVAASCRCIGMDFMALTDHRKYLPSLEAIRALADCPSDLVLFTGEEVHPPDSLVHILNIGGSASVNELFSTEAYVRGVDRVAAALGSVPADCRRAYAACLWCFERIREFGGISILAHPYWLTHNAYNICEPLLALLFEHMPFDALEVIGGYASVYREANSLQAARYHEERSRGRHIPALASSDAHGCDKGELFGWYWSVVFSPTLTLADIAASIRGEYCVAVETLPGEQPRITGPFRLVKYAHFLLREVFPLHDEIASEEGRLMLRWLAGDAQAREVLALYRGRTARLYDRLWAGGRATP
jgi:hypothetical protein